MTPTERFNNIFHILFEKKYLNLFSDYPYIFNLGHGVLPETNPETIEFVIKLINGHI